MSEATKSKKKTVIIVIAVILLAIIGAIAVVMFGGEECKYEGCDSDSLRALDEGVSRYCEYHACIEPDCKNPAAEDEDLCEEHKNDHACFYTYPAGDEWTCDNKAIKGQEFCKKHTCATDGCAKEIEDYSKYCGSHGCPAEGCTNTVIEGKKCCSEHKCGIESCYVAAITGEYCKNHGCEACGEACEEGSKMCSVHQDSKRCEMCGKYGSNVNIQYDITDGRRLWCGNCWRAYKEKYPQFYD